MAPDRPCQACEKHPPKRLPCHGNRPSAKPSVRHFFRTVAPKNHHDEATRLIHHARVTFPPSDFA